VKIRYKTGLAVFILVCGSVVLATTFLTGLSISTFSGVLALLVGIGYLVRPLAELTETQLILFALVGPVKRQYPTAQLRLQDGRIYAGEKKVPLPAWTVNGEDWGALMQRIRARPSA
jgi:hypothetical protein